jgi:hypothetical protein
MLTKPVLAAISMANAVDIAIGLLVVFIAGSLAVSGMNETVARLLGTRSKDLWSAIRALIDGVSTRANLRPGDDGLQGSITQALYDSPFVNEFRRVDHAGRTLISEIRPNAFARGLVHALVPDPTGMDGTAVLNQAVAKLPDDAPAKAVLRDLAAEVSGSVADARKGVETWFDGEMSRLSRNYRRRVRWLGLLFGIVLAVGANVDVIFITHSLNRNDDLRAVAAATGREIASSCDGKTGAEFQTCFATATKSADTSAQKVTYPIGWGDPTNDDLTWPKLLGWALAAVAFMQGAPFWFDLLRRLTGIKPGPAP